MSHNVLFIPLTSLCSSLRQLLTLHHLSILCPFLEPPRPTLTSDKASYNINETATLTCASQGANTFLFNFNGHIIRDFESSPDLVIQGKPLCLQMFNINVLIICPTV